MVSCFQVSLHGGQVRSWKTDRGEELLFSSSKVIFVSAYFELKNVLYIYIVKSLIVLWN